MMIRVN